MEESTAKKVFIFTSIAFFSFGIMWATIGPLLSSFSENNRTTLATIGGVYSAIFLGAITSQLFLGPFTDRIGHLRMLTISLLTISVAMVTVSLSHWLPLTFVLSFVAGLGQGTTNLCGNVLIGQLFPKKSVTYVNMLNLFWGIGATIGPMLVSASISIWNTGFIALWVSAILIVGSTLFLMIRFFNVKTSSQSQTSTGTAKRISITPFLWSMGIVGLIYVGIENSMSGWSTTYMQQTTNIKLELAALVTALFWFAITCGRLMGTLLGSRLTSRQILILCLAITAAGAVVFVAGFGNGILSMIAIFLIGLGQGAFYPTTIAVVTQTFSQAPGQAATLFTLLGSLGGVFIPWLQGVLMEQAGIRSGTYMVAVLVALLIGSFAVSQRFVKKRA
jgi:fucose permease